MHTFKDKYDQAWHLDLDLGMIREIERYDFAQALRREEEFYISFFPPQEDLFDVYLTNSAVIFGVIWVLCRDQVEGKSYKNSKGDKKLITNELDFARCFSGKSLDSSRLALYEELPDFFQDHKTTLTTLSERMLAAYKIADEKMNARLTVRLSDEQIGTLIDENLQMEQMEFEDLLAKSQKELQGRMAGKKVIPVAKV